MKRISNRTGLPMASVAVILITTAGCGETQTTENEEPPVVETSCAFAAVQTGNGTELDCTIEGDVADIFIDPLNSDNDDCTPNNIADAGLFTLSDQVIDVPATMILGAEGDDVPGRLRIDVQLASGTHDAELGKTPPNCGEAPIRSAVNTTFSGTHRSIIDREASPYCIRRSTYSPSNFSQTLGENGPGIELATRAATEDIIARRIDLEIALAANNSLNPDAELSDEFRERSGRCDYAYGPFEE